MPTIKKRLNITLPAETEETIKKLAQRDKTSQGGKVIELLHSALDIEEDDVWNELAQNRDKMNAKYISHKNAWE